MYVQKYLFLDPASLAMADTMSIGLLLNEKPSSSCQWRGDATTFDAKRATLAVSADR